MLRMELFRITAKCTGGLPGLLSSTSRPNRSAKNRADATLSCAGTSAWLSVMVIHVAPSGSIVPRLSRASAAAVPCCALPSSAISTMSG